MIARDAVDNRHLIRETRWALACQITGARATARRMRRLAAETMPTDWRLARAYLREAVAREDTIAVLRAVSRTLRGT